MYTFRLHRRGLVLAALGALLAAVLLVVGGCLVGEWRAGRAAAIAAAEGTGAGSADELAGEGFGVDGTAGGPIGDPAAEPVRFTLRLGTFASQEEAQALADQAAGRGYASAVVPAETAGGTPIFSVTVGTYGSRWEARGAARELAEREERRGWRPVVVPVPAAP